MVRLNQAALDLLQVELRHRTRSSYAQVGFVDALSSLDAAQSSTAVSPAEVEDIANELVSHRLKRLHDSQGNPVTYLELRQLIIDLIPNFSDVVIRKAARLNRPALTEMPAIWPSVPMVQWSNLVLGAMVGGVGVLALPFLQSTMRSNWTQVVRQMNWPGLSTSAIVEVDVSRSSELIPTAKTFAGIVTQRMNVVALTTQEWHSVVNQWQEAIDLLQQVPEADAEYSVAQNLIKQYQAKQTKAQQRLKQERQARTALKSAMGRSDWLLKRLKTLKPQQKAMALKQVEAQLKPVVKGTTVYEAGKQLRERMKKQLK